MSVEELEKRVNEKAKEFGLKVGERNNSNAVVRSNIQETSLKEGGAYFGYIRPEEAPSGIYYDVSFVVFPQKSGPCVIAIAVGSAGFQRDYGLVSTPWLRRLYKKLASPDRYSFIKNDFTNIESSIPELLETIENEDNLRELRATIIKYNKFILAARAVDPNKDFDVISAWLAQYAQLRRWGTKKEQRNKQEKAIKNLLKEQQSVDIEGDIKGLLRRKRFVVLQGAPGVGKTYNALKMAESYEGSYLIQFHAETSYADFVEGIRPDLSSDQLIYKAYEGKLVEAIKAAKEVNLSGGRILLIIDEINRANLPNVLGPVFFLFENYTGERNTPLQAGTLSISHLPDNLDVIATMNTADRSLAVVDFALRRRFAWYTIRPQSIKPGKGEFFDEELFHKFCDIFERYASDEELNLQPGPSYFLTDDKNNKEIMKERLIYELMPLIKEYLAEGLMQKAADSFSQLFYAEAGVYLFE